MKRTKWKSNKKEPPKILLPELSGRILRILTGDEYQLWNFYRDCAKHQNTDQPRCPYWFIISPKGLKWTRNKIAKNNGRLQEKGLIELFQRRKGIDWGHSYVKLFFTMDEDKLIAAETQRSIDGRSKSTDNFNKKSSKTKPVLSSNEPANTEKDSVVRRPRSTRTTYYNNALESINKHTSGTHPPSVVPSVQKKEEEEDNLPLEEVDEYGLPVRKRKPKPMKPKRVLPKRVKLTCPEAEEDEDFIFGESFDCSPAICKPCKLRTECQKKFNDDEEAFEAHNNEIDFTNDEDEE